MTEKTDNNEILFDPTASKTERYEKGRAIRKIVPRSSHQQYVPSENREDPVDILIRTSIGRIESLLPIRYTRMMESPFAFFRGAAAIMTADLEQTPNTGIDLQLCGDCHLMNFGGFATPERKLVFDINDFDETFPGPWEWDVKRLAASFVIAGKWRKFSKKNCKEFAWNVADSYKRHMLDYSKLSALQIWYADIDLAELIELGKDEEIKEFHQKRIKKAAEYTAHEKEFAKMTYRDGVRARIKDEPPLIYHPSGNEEDQILKEAEIVHKRYLKSLPEDKQVLLSRYSMHDFAIKVVGVGSVGTLCGISLLMSATGEPIFLQFKEARKSVLEQHVKVKAKYTHQGERIVIGQKLMQSASDMFLGWTNDDKGRFFYIRQLRDAKVKPVLEIMKEENMIDYAKACGWALARAHARSGDPSMLSGYIGDSNEFANSISKFSLLYADQNESDYNKMVKAVKEGRLPIAAEI
ncbi:DUF2252 domain-containing protein [Flavobacterium johnsoniae]|uniref:DUF2252 domain-containing protein n=1 Tax=Flavobacterium johnsoniae (strain ATCC 17061 / DSM 2064 / JCM 8514 / BCRC 14874 / CCUG 350202 / NBRC 14942 / NCIMB 11054 / UW101) TaxID=376686 RepID=A5FKU0_FLAJ1|nr:DUF2252 domain-containing protein [Flavobacterium johnsoniae]ABQ04178.1 Uncharacterized protein Fjoh_1145 [Flavobacterium johnsoniae UW101]OXG02588.1 hypothetical protein B0A63_02740 [Flavobacterium johnsoniae UW101]WQG84027.1 DUF2252 domain-containing protein [Flavobacterium johnsoniae UW101]SHK14688.1 Uncharacterized conserved protein, DUF2252 family [Flavobacterium johnsoniae]